MGIDLRYVFTFLCFRGGVFSTLIMMPSVKIFHINLYSISDGWMLIHRLPNSAQLFYSGPTNLKSALTQMAMVQIRMTAVSPVSPHYNIPQFIFPAITAKAAHLSHIHAVLATTSFLQAGTPAELCGWFRTSYKAGYKVIQPTHK